MRPFRLNRRRYLVFLVSPRGSVDDRQDIAGVDRLAFPARNLAEHARLIGGHVDIDFLGLELDK